MENTPAQNNVPSQVPPAQKKRHGCLTALLIFIIAINILGAILVGAGAGILGDYIDTSGWFLPLNVIMPVLTVVFAIGIFMWKKWGFWGLVAVQVITVIINIIGGSYFSIIGAVIAIGILFGTLQIGKEDKGWPQLE